MNERYRSLFPVYKLFFNTKYIVKRTRSAEEQANQVDTKHGRDRGKPSSVGASGMYWDIKTITQIYRIFTNH
jgi:hypothetical protein